jgi:hypothetical protein
VLAAMQQEDLRIIQESIRKADLVIFRELVTFLQSDVQNEVCIPTMCANMPPGAIPAQSVPTG